jgi:putative ABC transport system ATP-binding protein
MSALGVRPEPTVLVRGLNHSFGTGDVRKQVLLDVDLALHPGEIVIVTGPSGSGKTTLLTLLGGLRSVQEGNARVLGHELNGLDRRGLVDVRRRIGFIFQAHNLFEALTAFQNVQLALELHGIARHEARARVTELLTRVGLGQRLDYKPRALSVGQRQRVAIARALVNRPKLIMADEPTAALDKDSGRDVVLLLQQLAREEGCTIILVTHDYRILDVGDRIVTMVDGRISSDMAVKQAVASGASLKDQLVRMFFSAEAP